MNIVKSKKKIYFPKTLEDAPLSSALVITNYRIRGLFGGDFNLAVWRIFTGSPNTPF